MNENLLMTRKQNSHLPGVLDFALAICLVLQTVESIQMLCLLATDHVKTEKKKRPLSELKL